jgi:hypothetical protein
MARMREEFVGPFGRHGRNLQTIEKPAACEMRSVIRFLNLRSMKPADIHRQLCEVYGEHAMSDSVVRRWVSHFNEGCNYEHDDPRSGRLSVVNEDLVCTVEEKITISSLSLHFPQISQSLLHEIVSDKLCFRKLRSRWVPKLLMDEHKMKQAKWHAYSGCCDAS